MEVKILDIQIDEFKNIIENIKNDIKNTRFKILEEANVELLNLYFRLGKILNDKSNVHIKYGRPSK